MLSVVVLLAVAVEPKESDRDVRPAGASEEHLVALAQVKVQGRASSRPSVWTPSTWHRLRPADSHSVGNRWMDGQTEGRAAADG